jgi:ABC-type polysaccharide/polyol phosphate export permease
MSYFRELLQTRELLYNLVAREVKGQYRRTVFGQLWSLINPIATMVVYSIVFGLIFRARPAAGDPSGLDVYPLWLMSGLLAWSFFTRVVNGGLNSVVSNSGLVKKVYFPRMHLPFAVTLSTGFTWGIELGVLVVALHVFGGFPLPWLPLLLVFMVLLALFATGLGMLLAILNVHFRDTKHFVSILLQMWMYLTPIIYPIRLVEEASRDHPWVLVVYRLNPMEHFVLVFRNLLYDNRLPELADVLWCVGTAGIVFALGYLVFARAERRLAELL